MRVAFNIMASRCIFEEITSRRLANLTGISVKIWMNLRESYDIKLLEIENKKSEDKEKIHF